MVILTPLDRTDFEKILENYNIGGYKSHEHLSLALSNTVYLLRTTKGKFILKIFEEADRNFIEYQIKVGLFLQEHGIRVAEIVKSREGKAIFCYGNKNLVIQKFVEGKPLKILNSVAARDVGKKLGLLHKELLKLKLNGKEYNWSNPQWQRLEIHKAGDSVLTRPFENLEKEIQKMDFRKLKKCIIHGDLSRPNLLFKKSRLVAFIDWDDVHKDYLITDIAILIAHLFLSPRKVYFKEIKILLKNYQEEIQLNDTEKKTIYWIIKIRLITAIAYLENQKKNHQDTTRILEKKKSGWLKSLGLFDKISLEKFLSCFES